MPKRLLVLPAALAVFVLAGVITAAAVPGVASTTAASTVTVTPTPIDVPVAVGSSTSVYTVQPDPVTVTVIPETVTVTASPSPSTSTSAAPAPLWVGDYNDGTLNAFQATSWNNVPYAPTVVASPAYEGAYAGAYTIPAGGSRCENVPLIPGYATNGEFGEGSDFWFGWSTELATGFPLSVPNWQVITQWKNDGIGSPPLELDANGGVFHLGGGYGWPGNTTNIQPKLFSLALGAAKTGVWDRWTAHILFSSDPTTATVDLWRNGVQVVTGYHPAGGTLYPGLTSYLKDGYYRDSAIKTDGTVYEDGWKVGTSQASVAP